MIVISVVTEQLPQASLTAGEYFVQRTLIWACPPHNLCHRHKRENEIYSRMASPLLHQKHASALKLCFTKIGPKVKLYSSVFVLYTRDFLSPPQLSRLQLCENMHLYPRGENRGAKRLPPESKRESNSLGFASSPVTSLNADLMSFLHRCTINPLTTAVIARPRAAITGFQSN